MDALSIALFTEKSRIRGSPGSMVMSVSARTLAAPSANLIAVCLRLSSERSLVAASLKQLPLNTVNTTPMDGSTASALCSLVLTVISSPRFSVARAAAYGTRRSISPTSFTRSGFSLYISILYTSRFERGFYYSVILAKCYSKNRY